ncbi:hypothetical protein, partial [Microcystis sp. M061S2]|uniref:hypothetical protein n=1 Tax=Microcystis sp. M061S2 TaxID=2771171 RepID=UPI00259005EB
NLTTIGGNANFRNSQVTNLGNLTTIGGQIYFNEDIADDFKYELLGKFKNIEKENEKFKLELKNKINELKRSIKEAIQTRQTSFMASVPKEDFTEALNEYDNLIKNPKGTTEYIKKFGLEKIKKIKDITSNFGTYIAALEKSNYITKKIC